jgi:hypothetical protein
MLRRTPVGYLQSDLQLEFRGELRRAGKQGD